MGSVVRVWSLHISDWGIYRAVQKVSSSDSGTSFPSHHYHNVSLKPAPQSISFSLHHTYIYPRPKGPLPVVRIVASTDGEQYCVVDLSGAPDGKWIRQCILLKVIYHIPLIRCLALSDSYHQLSIPETMHGRFSIYPSEAGSLALGGALCDRSLFSHCRKTGDPSGSLKFFVSTSPDQPLRSNPGSTGQSFAVGEKLIILTKSANHLLRSIKIDRHSDTPILRYHSANPPRNVSLENDSRLLYTPSGSLPLKSLCQWSSMFLYHCKLSQISFLAY